MDSPSADLSNQPVLVDRGVPLAWTQDPPEIRVYAWALMHFGFAPGFPIDVRTLAGDCRIRISEAERALRELVLSGDLKVERDLRKRETYWLAPIRWDCAS